MVVGGATKEGVDVLGKPEEQHNERRFRVGRAVRFHGIDRCADKREDLVRWRGILPWDENAWSGRPCGEANVGGGIWLASDNRLVDGGLGGSAPEIGTYNNEWGWGMGIENAGVEPDYEVDNDPKLSFRGVDEQLVVGIKVLNDLVTAKRASGVAVERPGAKKNVVVETDGMC